MALALDLVAPATPLFLDARSSVRPVSFCGVLRREMENPLRELGGEPRDLVPTSCKRVVPSHRGELLGKLGPSWIAGLLSLEKLGC